MRPRTAVALVVAPGDRELLKLLEQIELSLMPSRMTVPLGGSHQKSLGPAKLPGPPGESG